MHCDRCVVRPWNNFQSINWMLLHVKKSDKIIEERFSSICYWFKGSSCHFEKSFFGANQMSLPYHFSENDVFEVFVPCIVIGASYGLKTAFSIGTPGAITCKKGGRMCRKHFPPLFYRLEGFSWHFKKGFLEPPQMRLPYHISKNGGFEVFVPCIVWRVLWPWNNIQSIARVWRQLKKAISWLENTFPQFLST